MLEFCGQENIVLEGNGRIRLPRQWVEDFMRHGNGEVVIHGLPEGAVAIYPEEVYRAMRTRELGDLDRAGGSFAARRSMRRFGALTAVDQLSAQGRVTLPEAFREYAGLISGSKVRVVGVEIGLEIWETGRFNAEMAAADEEMQRKREAEFSVVNGDPVP